MYHLSLTETHIRPMFVSPAAFVPQDGEPARLVVEVPMLLDQHVFL